MTDCITINRLAKILSGRGYNIGQNLLAEQMRKHGWLMYDYDDLVPKQTEINEKRMIYETYIATDQYGREIECGRTLITMKGMRYYYKQLVGTDYDRDVNYRILPEENTRTVTIVIPEGKYNLMTMIASSEGKTLEQYVSSRALI